MILETFHLKAFLKNPLRGISLYKTSARWSMLNNHAYTREVFTKNAEESLLDCVKYDLIMRKGYYDFKNKKYITRNEGRK